MTCKYAQAAQELDEQELADVQAMSANVAAKFLAVGATTIKDHRRGECMCVKTPTAEPVQAAAGKLELTSDGGSFTGIEVTEPIRGDWSAVFTRFNLDPNEFTIADEQPGEVTMALR